MDWSEEKRLIVHTDASFYLEHKKGLIAFVIENQNNKLMKKKNRCITCKSSQEAEYIAIGEVCKWLNFYQKANIIRNRIIINIFNDNKTLIQSINNLDSMQYTNVRTEIIMKYNEEINKLRNNNNVYIKWKSRNGNKVADALTRPRNLFAMI